MQGKISNPIIRAILFFGGIVFCFFLYSKYKFRNLDENARYIFGSISYISPTKNGKSFHYLYMYMGESFQGSYIGSASDFRKGDFILIKFQSTDPKIHKALYKYKFLNNVNSKEFPLNGWDTLPVKMIFEGE